MIRNKNFKRLVTIAIAAIMCLVIVPQVNADIPTNMVAYWKFDEGIGSTVYDETTNDNDGTLSGGKFGNALEFDGVDDCVDVPDSDSLDTGTEFTVEAWFKTDDVNKIDPGTGSKTQTIVMYGWDSADGKNNPMHIRDGKLYVAIRGYGGGYEDLVGVTSILSNTWYHAALSYDGTNARLYLDGNLEVSQAATMNLDTNSRVLIGRYQNPLNMNYFFAFDGVIDEVCISNIARTTFNLNYPPSDDGNVAALWHFDESVGTVVYDKTINNNDVTINGATWAGPMWATGQVTGALEFDGVDDYVSTSFNADTDIGDDNPFTIEAWVFPKEIQGSPFSRMVVASMASKRFYFGVHQGYWRWGIGSQFITVTDAPATLNSWQHVAWVYDGSNVKIYVDGALMDNRLYTGDGDYPNLDVKIGALTRQPGYNPPITNYFDGKIDELAIYNTALSAEEISYHYCLGYNFEHGYYDPPSLTYTGALLFGDTDDLVLEATLKDSGGYGMLGYNIEFFVNDVSAGIDETDVDGIASINLGSQLVDVYEVYAKVHCLESDTVFIAVYDPTAGFVTGGGWIDSPAGAYKPDESLTGKANFGFVSKYKKGQSIPTGNTEFQFKAGSMNFHSSEYEWLVITGGGKAMFKGNGTINGEGFYKFMITAWDGEISGGDDTFRIKIWYEVDDVEFIVYDNGSNQGLGGGQIKIHEG